MKKLYALFILLAIVFTAQAEHVEEVQAKKIAQNFLTSRAANPSATLAQNLELVYTAASQAVDAQATLIPQVYYYVFTSGTQGYIIIAGDDNAAPVLGYSTESGFNVAEIPPAVAKWLEGYKQQMRDIIQNKIPATEEIKAEWIALEGLNTNQALARKTAGVSPMVQTKWDQGTYYNPLCPYDNSYNQRTVTGCVATAMAQIMKFWNYPSKGSGYHTYSHSTYGTLSANFGSTSYNWGSMPTGKVTSSNSAVATLMYHAGVSVDMNYGVGATGGSGAYVISAQSPVTHCSEYAMKNYFGYKSSLKGVERKNYTQSQWITLIKSELDAGRPVLYAGFGNGGGHAFVADGYDNNDYIHFNWGWSGSYDGYFHVSALNPSGTGTGGGSGGYNSGQQALIGIEPPQGNNSPQLDMRLYSSITVNPNIIQYNSSFSVSVMVANYGTSTTQNFQGDFTAAVFNSNQEFVGYIETKTGHTLNYNSYFTNPIQFSTSGMSSLTPGNYIIGIYYKPAGATQWSAFGDGSYQNFINVEVKGSDTNPMRLYASITTDPAVIVQNQTFTVNFDVANFGTTNFSGDISVDIHKSDGSWIRELSIKNGISLQAGYHFTNGLTYTISGGISDAPGTYQLFIWSKPNGGKWDFLGSGNYSNPITIQVVVPGLTADMYEPNNNVGDAYLLPLNFNNNNAVRQTTGSNCHIGSDYDYYKLNLPSGYNYTINARLHDSYNSGNGQAYTLDALFTYSLNGSSWSDAYDDVMSGPIVAKGGSTAYFKVSPYFTGDKGTYLLDINLTRQSTVSIKENPLAGLIKIYPNPAKEFITIDASELTEKVHRVRLLDLSGKTIHTIDADNFGQRGTVNLHNIAAGVYFVEIHCNSGIINKKLVVAK